MTQNIPLTRRSLLGRAVRIPALFVGHCSIFRKNNGVLGSAFYALRLALSVLTPVKLTMAEVVSVRPGDVVVFKIPASAPAQEMEMLHRKAKSLFPNNDVLVLRDSVSVQVVAQAKEQ